MPPKRAVNRRDGPVARSNDNGTRSYLAEISGPQATNPNLPNIPAKPSWGYGSSTAPVIPRQLSIKSGMNVDDMAESIESGVKSAQDRDENGQENPESKSEASCKFATNKTIGLRQCLSSASSEKTRAHSRSGAVAWYAERIYGLPEPPCGRWPVDRDTIPSHSTRHLDRIESPLFPHTQLCLQPSLYIPLRFFDLILQPAKEPRVEVHPSKKTTLTMSLLFHGMLNAIFMKMIYNEPALLGFARSDKAKTLQHRLDDSRALPSLTKLSRRKMSPSLRHPLRTHLHLSRYQNRKIKVMPNLGLRQNLNQITNPRLPPRLPSRLPPSLSRPQPLRGQFYLERICAKPRLWDLVRRRQSSPSRPQLNPGYNPFPHRPYLSARAK